MNIEMTDAVEMVCPHNNIQAIHVITNRSLDKTILINCSAWTDFVERKGRRCPNLNRVHHGAGCPFLEKKKTLADILARA